MEAVADPGTSVITTRPKAVLKPPLSQRSRNHDDGHGSEFGLKHMAFPRQTEPGIPNHATPF
jgi:hypothetical protein